MMRKDNADRLNRRDAVLDGIFVECTDNSLTRLLDTLNQHSEFTSMWFCGSRIDHMRCLGSEEIGWGVSALPGDFDKARMPKYHPHQVEIMIPIHGPVCVETYTRQEGLDKTTIEQGGIHEHIVLNRDVCHRIKRIGEGYVDSAFFYVKTNVGQQPQDIGVRDNNDLTDACHGCKHHSDRQDCPIFQSYQKD